MKPIDHTEAASKLGVTVKEYEALLDVRRMLAAGELKYGSVEGHFNMALWHPEASPTCGTPLCIGGWMQALGAIQRHGWSNAFQRLFYPPNLSNRLTPPQAVRAIDLFFAGNKNPWPQAVREIAADGSVLS